MIMNHIATHLHQRYD